MTPAVVCEAINPAKELIGAPRRPRAGTIRVLFLIDQLCGKGGAEAALVNTVRWLPKRFQPSVITFKLNPSLPLLADFPCSVRELPLRRTYDFNALKLAIHLGRFIRQERVDIVHTFFASADLWGGVVARLARRPILISSRRDLGFQRSAKHRIGYRALRHIYDRVIANSERVREYSILEDRLDPAKVQTIYNAVDLNHPAESDSAAKLREQLGLSSSSPIVACVANVRYIKGLDVFLRAAALVEKKIPHAAFVVAGDTAHAEPGYLEQLDALKKYLGAHNLRFVGPLESVAPLLRASSLFCLLSRSEGFSNALIEAMACGLPCVATRVGGNEEALDDGGSGFLVENEDYVSAAARICDLLQDPLLASSMGEHGRRVVQERFLPQVATSKLVQVYDELLNARNHAKHAAR